MNKDNYRIRKTIESERIYKNEIMEKMLKIQEKYNNEPKLFQKDKQFIKLSNLLGIVRKEKISLNKIIID